MGKVNKSKTVTCPFYYVFTAQSKGRFTQIHSPAPLTVHILRIWQQSAYGWLRPPRQLYCHIWSSKAAPALASHLHLTQEQELEMLQVRNWSTHSGVLVYWLCLILLPTFADFTPPLKGLMVVWKCWMRSFNLVYSFYVLKWIQNWSNNNYGL